MITPVLEQIIKSLVDVPQAVAISEKQEDNRLVFSITVQESDLGRVIGKEGNTIRAIRTIAQLLAPAGCQVVVDLANQ